MTLPVRVEVYENDNATLVCELNGVDGRQVRSLQGRKTLDGPGDGTVEVDFDHPHVNELTGGRFVRAVEVDGDTTAFSFRIRETRRVLRSSGGALSGRTLSAAGGGPLEVLKLGRVRPWLGFGKTPSTRRRKFDWSSPQLDTSDWLTPYEQDRLTSEPGKPFGIPSLFRTRWLGPEPEASLMTVGPWCIRRTFTIPEPSQISIFSSADDTFMDCVHGVEIQNVSPAFPAKVWHTPYRTPVYLDNDTIDYVYAARVNNDLGPTAFISDAWTTSSTGLGDQVFMSGLPEGDEYDFLYGEGAYAWLVYPNPQGEWFTVGEILRILLDECQANGELLDVTLGCTDTQDSAGTPWPKIEFECDATGTLLAAVELLQAVHADIAMSDEGLVLDAWVKDGRGEATSIDLTYAAREIGADAIETDWELENDVALVNDKGTFYYESPLSVLAYGRHPGATIGTGSITDEPVLEQIAIAHLSPRTNPSESRAVEITHLADFTAQPGDTVTVEGESLRVIDVAYQLGSDGALRKVPALNTAYQERRRRADLLVQRWIDQYGDSAASARVIDTGTQIEAGPIKPVEIESWSWQDATGIDPQFYDAGETEPRPWQPFTVKESARLVALIIKCDWAEPDGAGGLTKVTTGDSVFVLMRNGAPTVPPFVATVPEINPESSSDPSVFAIAYILGEGLVNPTVDTLSVSCTTNGGHVNGAASIWAVDPS